MSALEFHETMAGSFRLAGGGDDRPMSFTIRARAGRLLSFLRRPEMEIEGEVDAEGFADHCLLRGTLVLDLVRAQELPYAFRFRANDGKDYVFEGKKTVRAASFAESMTVLPGTIREADGGREVGSALLRFDLRSDLLKWLRSFRFGR